MYIYTGLCLPKTIDMKKILASLYVTLALISCNTGEKNDAPTMETTNTETEVVDGDAAEIPDNLMEIKTDEALIATALMAAPEVGRAGAKVIGYNMAGEFVTLKEGTNEFIVLADDPKKEGFSAACYHKDLEPFMARGRALKAEGKTHQEIFDIREAEAKSGKLDMGKAGSALHIYFGGEGLYDPETFEVHGAKYRYVVYVPWATAESTGLPEMPISSNHPWIMNPGTHRAHIMISPIPEDKKL